MCRPENNQQDEDLPPAMATIDSEKTPLNFATLATPTTNRLPQAVISSERRRTRTRAPTITISKIFIDDLTENRRVWHVPWFVVEMCLFQILTYWLANDCLYQRFMLIPAGRLELWRYFTYTLVHSDIVHLTLNSCLQCLVGLILECEQGHWKVALVYVIGGISGSLATAWLQPQLSLLGASACVYAMLMSHIPHMMKNFPQLPYRYFRIVALAILCLTDVGFTTFHFLVKHNANPRICLQAHVGGALAGLCMGFLIYSKSKSDDDDGSASERDSAHVSDIGNSRDSGCDNGVA